MQALYGLTDLLIGSDDTVSQCAQLTPQRTDLLLELITGPLDVSPNIANFFLPARKAIAGINPQFCDNCPNTVDNLIDQEPISTGDRDHYWPYDCGGERKSFHQVMCIVTRSAVRLGMRCPFLLAGAS